MPGDIALIVPYTNFANYRSVRENFYRFRQQQSVQPIVVELSLNGRFEAATESYDIRLTDSVHSVMHQRLRLVNLAIRQLPPEVTKIAWLDGDVCFDDQNWLSRVSELLDSVDIVRPFDALRCMNSNGTLRELLPITADSAGAMQYPHAWGVRLDILPQLPSESGNIGLLDRIGVFDDYLMAIAWEGQQPPQPVRDISPGVSHYCSQWYGTTKRRSFGQISEGASLLYSGTKPVDTVADRGYLAMTKFDPFTSITINPRTGLYNWTLERQRSIVYFMNTAYERSRDTHLPAILTPPVLEQKVVEPRQLISPLTMLPSYTQRRREPDRPTVTILAPGLGLGGAEQWVRMLVKNSRAFNWVIGVMSRENWHPLIATDVVENAEVHAALSDVKGVISHVNKEQMVLAAVNDTDAVLYWGSINARAIPTTAPITFVGHGTCKWTTDAATMALETGVQHFAAVSDNSANYIRAVTPDVTAIWNGVDTTRLQLPEDRAAIRRQWRYDSYGYAKYVGYLGRLGDEKNVDSLIQAMQQLPYCYSLVLIGCTGAHRDRILKLARTVLPGRLTEVPATDDIGPLLGSLDCLVQVSPREGNSLTICEAWHCRVPVVSTPTGAIPEMEAIAGHPLVSGVPATPLASEIADVIRQVCENPPVRQVEQAYRFARKYLTADVMCQNWERYIRKIIGTSSR